MTIKKALSIAAIAGFSMMVACKGKPNDSELQTKVTQTVKVPGVTSSVKDGVVTLSGTVSDDASKAAAEAAAKGTEGVTSVTNDIMVVAPAPAAPAPGAVVVSADDALTTAVKDATKDFPEVTATVKDGVVSVSGNITAAKWKTLKMSLDGLKPKKVDASGLKVK